MIYAVKSVELSRELRLCYAEQGNDSGIPVVFLHGVTDSWHSFETVFSHLPEPIHAFALTQRGHGDSSRPQAGYRFNDFSKDLSQFMDALGIESAVIVGHSMGSSVAQCFAIDFPERTLGLVLAGSFTTLRGNPCVKELWDCAVSKMKDPVDPGFVRDFQQTTAPVAHDFFETVVAESLKVPARVWKAVFEGFLEDDFSNLLGRIEAPTLIVRGEKDALCPMCDQEKLISAITGSKFVSYEGCGHALHWEQPERFASDLVDFVKSLGSPAAKGLR